MPKSSHAPNILMIVTDQQRRDTIGAYGSQVCQTPNVDRLAANGMTFDYAFTPIGLCSPVRSSLLTGVYPHTHNVLTNNKLHPVRTELQPEQDVLVKSLKQQGYRLGYAGKWHVNSTHDPTAFGFERYTSLNDYDAYRQAIGIPLAPETHNYIVPTSGVDATITPEQSQPAFLADHAMQMIADFCDDPEHPFFVRLDFHGPHAPTVIPEPYASMYDPLSLPPWPNFEDTLEGKPVVQQIKRLHWGTDRMTWADWQPLVAHYYGEISLIDAQVGRVLAYLEQIGERENTVVIYMSDHGDTMGAHKIWNKDYTMYDEIYRIPFIVDWPGVTAAGSRCDSYIQHGIDLMPTLLEIAGAPCPSNIDGQSLIPLLRGEPQDRLREAFCEFHGCHMGLYSIRMLQTDRFKYVFYPNDFDELYDHDADPYEMHNLARDPAYADVLRDMKQRMVGWMARTKDHIYNEWVVYWLTDDKQQALAAPGRTNTAW
jgi:arylsulfatase A-like enzyme